MRRLVIALPLLCGFLLTACSTDQEELEAWMDQQKREARPNVRPLSPPTKFDPEAYSAQGRLDPFDVQKVTGLLRKEAKAANALLSAEMIRRKEPLEAYPLDAIRMVGSILRGSKPQALLAVDKLIYQVRIGDYMGQNYGRILRISETEIQLREVVQDPSGEWVEKMTTLQLQEGAK